MPLLITKSFPYLDHLSTIKLYGRVFEYAELIVFSQFVHILPNETIESIWHPIEVVISHEDITLIKNLS